ncbi:MAG: hypothetical protein ACJ8R9_10825 [Steroidobacteraceae bacterium]
MVHFDDPASKSRFTPPHQPQHKASALQVRAFRKLVDRAKLLIAATVLDEQSTVLPELRSLLAKDIQATRLPREMTELAGITARDELANSGYVFMNGKKIAASEFKSWSRTAKTEKDAKHLAAVKHVFADYEKDAMTQFRRLEKREYLSRVAQGITRDRKLLAKAKASVKPKT